MFIRKIGFTIYPKLFLVISRTIRVETQVFFAYSERAFLKLGSHHGDHIRRPTTKFDLRFIAQSRRQSIPTNCPHSVLRSSPVIRFLKFITFFAFISNRLISYKPTERNLLSNFSGRIIFSK